MEYIKIQLGPGITRWYANPKTWFELTMALEEGGTFFDYDPNAKVSEKINDELKLFL